MSIGANSRYATADIVTLSVNGKPRSVVYYTQLAGYTFNFFVYAWQDSDTIDNVAGRFLGDATQWWKIAQANPDVTLDWRNVAPGTPIRIPQV